MCKNETKETIRICSYTFYNLLTIIEKEIILRKKIGNKKRYKEVRFFCFKIAKQEKRN